MQFWSKLSVGDKMALLGPIIAILLWWFFIGRQKFGIRGVAN